MVWPSGLKKPGLTDQGVATGVSKFRMASGGLKKIVKNFKNIREILRVLIFLDNILEFKQKVWEKFSERFRINI